MESEEMIYHECDEQEHLEDSFRNGDFASMPDTVHFIGKTIQTEVLSKREWRGQPIGAIRHQGYLVSVWRWGADWLEGRTIRKLSLCPFCAFFEQDARFVGEGKVGDIPACDVCASGPDITEMLMEWYEEQH
jgi:hypothetical protein